MLIYLLLIRPPSADVQVTDGPESDHSVTDDDESHAAQQLDGQKPKKPFNAARFAW